MPTVQIYFYGVAVHLIGVIPGVPCRIVMPDATASYLYSTGEECLKDTVELDRHFTFMEWEDPTGWQHEKFYRERMMIGNPDTSKDFKLDPSMGWIYHLPNWIPNLQLSSEVIYAGRTALYFDVLYGTLAAHRNTVNGPVYTSLTVETEEGEPPQLLRVPFHYASYDFDPQPPDVIEWNDMPSVLHISNSGKGCSDPKNCYDFALSFLVTRGGIPCGMKDLPGANGGPPKAWKNAKYKKPKVAAPDHIMDSLSAACSASSFPKPG